MKYSLLVVLFVLDYWSSPKVSAQVALISQVEMAPTNLNPSLTGDVENSVRILSYYGNQKFSSTNLKNHLVSIDGSIDLGKMNSLGIGFLTYFVNPGSYKFGRKKFSITSSLIHYFYKDENSYKALALGVDIGQAYNRSRYIPSESDSPFPNTLFSEWNHQYQISYLSVSSGIQWKQKVNSRFFL